MIGLSIPSRHLSSVLCPLPDTKAGKLFARLILKTQIYLILMALEFSHKP